MLTVRQWARLTSARPCTRTTFVLMCSVCCRRWKAKDVLLTGSWLKLSDWLCLRLMDQSQEILLGHSVFASREYGYHGYRHIAIKINVCRRHPPHRKQLRELIRASEKLQETNEFATSSYLLWFWQRSARLLSCFATSGWSLPNTCVTSNVISQ